MALVGSVKNASPPGRDERGERILAVRERLRRRAYMLTRDWDEAEDVVAAAVRRAWASSASFEDDDACFRLVARMVRWVVIDRSRSKQVPTVPMGDAPETAVSADPSRAMIVRRALAGLSANDQEILVLADHFGMSMEECGRVIGIGREAAKGRHKRAKVALKVRLRQEEWS